MPFKMSDDPVLDRDPATLKDINLDTPVNMSKREALAEAHARIANIVSSALDIGQLPDEIDCRRLREANDLMNLALKDEPVGHVGENINRRNFAEAHARIANIVSSALDIGQLPDKIDCDRIREAQIKLAEGLGYGKKTNMIHTVTSNIEP